MSETHEKTSFSGKLFLWLSCYKQDNDGDTPLHLLVAMWPESAAKTEKLIQITAHPALLDIQNKDGVTALHLAAMSSCPNIVRRLMIAGANPLIINHWGRIALHHACKAGNVGIIRALTTSFNADEVRRVTRFAMLPDLLSGLHARHFEGQTPLHVAVENGHLDAVKLLSSLGADIETVDMDGRTPLKIAVVEEFKSLTEFILKCYKKNWKDSMQYGIYLGMGKHLKRMKLEKEFIDTLRISKSRLYIPSDSSDD